MSEHPNVARILDLAGAIDRGELDAFVNAYSEDALYRVPGNNLVTGDYRGHQEIRDFLMYLFQMTGGTMRLELQDVVADDDHAMMFWRLTAERNGRSLDAHGAMAFKVNAAGKFIESWFLYSDQKEYEEFYA